MDFVRELISNGNPMEGTVGLSRAVRLALSSRSVAPPQSTRMERLSD